MKNLPLFVILLICSSALAMSPVDTCMFTQVSRMSTEGQKLAFRLTRTEVSAKVSESVQVVELAPVVKTVNAADITSIHAHDDSEHGVWNTTPITKDWRKLCKAWGRRCSAKRGLKICRRWHGLCQANGHPFAWRDIVVPDLPPQEDIRPNFRQICLKKKTRCVTKRNNVYC